MRHGFVAVTALSLAALGPNAIVASNVLSNTPSMPVAPEYSTIVNDIRSAMRRASKAAY